MHCENAQFTVSVDRFGRAWEHFWVGNEYKFSNQIPNPESYSSTHAGWILSDRGHCTWASTPPPRGNNIAVVTAPTVPSSTQAALVADAGVAPPPAAGMADPAAGGVMLLALVGAGIWHLIAQRRGEGGDYNPHADLDLTLPPLPVRPPQGNSHYGIRGLQADHLPGNSREFELNSQGQPVEPNANSHDLQNEGANGPNLGIPPVTEVGGQQEWGKIALSFDPLKPEEGDEFDMYRVLVERDGLASKGTDIIKELWNVSPGRSAAYAAARKRRDEFAKRLDYYRYEGR